MAKKASQKKSVKVSKKTVVKTPVKKPVVKATKKSSVVKKVVQKAIVKTSTKKPVAKKTTNVVKKQTKQNVKKVVAKSKPIQKKPAKATSVKSNKKPDAKKVAKKIVQTTTKAPVKKSAKVVKPSSKTDVKKKQPVVAKKLNVKKQTKEKKTQSAKKETPSVKEKKPVATAPIAETKVASPKGELSFSFRTDRPSHHIAFSLEDLDAYFKDMANNVQPRLSKKDFGKDVRKKVQPKKVVKGVLKLENKSEGVATIFDILGFNPVETPSIEKLEGKDVPKKWKKYYNKLVELRNHHTQGVTSRSEEVMKRSAKDDAGDLSSNGQHLADAGSASFERDLAYNMITNQTEILSEIDAAIKRIKDGTYGICEVTGKPIPEARLMAIPFARYTIEGQEIHELEQKRAKAIRRDNVFDIGMDVSGNTQKSEEEDSDIGM